ncbi:uncharacterized protein LOC136027669 [Artemia franciscana]|uniref:Paramyosin n=1 Tax=Artemia franciscana TaxID=6661 RepID=A0AA88HNX9_ARTSF|nr:hypothetical protein QYM36_012949 [Artemia franciscana]
MTTNAVTLFLLFGFSFAQREVPSAVTHTDIRDAIITLASAIRDISSKLERHEARENLLGDVLKKSISSIDLRTRGSQKNIEGVVKLLASFEKRMDNLESSVLQSDQRGKAQLQKILESVSGGRVSGGSDDNRQFFRLMKKVDNLEKSMLSRLPVIGNEVKIVGEKMEARSSRLEELLVSIRDGNVERQTEDTEKLRATAASLLSGESKISKAIGELDNISKKINSEVVSLSAQVSRINNDTAAIMTSVQSLHTSFDNVTSLNIGPAYSPIDPSELKEIDKNVKTTVMELEKVGNILVNNSLMLIDMEKKTVDELKDVKVVSEKSANSVAANLDRHMMDLAKKINDSQQTIHHQVIEAGDMAESLSERVEQGYQNISAEIRGLTNVEQVLLDTADSVMDTKRRLEYAVQQILLELGDTVRKQTGNLNTELTERVDNVTLAVLGQQGTAWKNLTSKLENELGQVWRQIAVLHQTASQSQNILDKMELQTVTHINGTLKTLANMDGKVLTVTTRMSEVEENLNYLLGRLSLVVQEFNQIRGGLGETLDSLRSNMAVIHEKIPGIQKSRSTSLNLENELERKETFEPSE